MRKEYDFSKGERGKFFRPDAQLSIPVCPEEQAGKPGAAGVFRANRPWKHPGGKLRELGAGKLDDAELLAILISSGNKGRPAETIARDLLARFGSLAGLANQPLEALLAARSTGSAGVAVR